MANVRTEPITGWAHCPDPRCDGRSQAEVQAVRETVERTYYDAGGDMPGVERSQTYVTFADESDSPCPSCGRPRECSDQQRVVYAPLSGHAQDGLLAFKPPEPKEVGV